METPHSDHAGIIVGDACATDLHLQFEMLELPAELRDMIYEALLTPHYGDINASLLQSCRQIHMEAQEVLYRRPISFSSQAKLFKWISQSRAINLQRVRSLTLQLTDIDPELLLSPYDQRPTMRKSLYCLYKHEVESLAASLSALPNLRSLTVFPPRSGRSYLPLKMYHSFLAEVPARCQKLKVLRIHDSEEVLTIVPQLQAIGSVEFKWIGEKHQHCVTDWEHESTVNADQSLGHGKAMKASVTTIAQLKLDLDMGMGVAEC